MEIGSARVVQEEGEGWVGAEDVEEGGVVD